MNSSLDPAKSPRLDELKL